MGTEKMYEQTERISHKCSNRDVSSCPSVYIEQKQKCPTTSFLASMWLGPNSNLANKWKWRSEGENIVTTIYDNLWVTGKFIFWVWVSSEKLLYVAYLNTTMGLYLDVFHCKCHDFGTKRSGSLIFKISGCLIPMFQGKLREMKCFVNS